MPKEPFIQPRFVGKRFEEHTLPVSAAKDLAAYEDLVIELARHLYKEKHSERERVPKGFAEDFHLHFERIDGGSAQPLLSVVFAAALFSDLPEEINEARELINQVIATDNADSLPVEFPKELYAYFNRIGRSLEEGEEIQWTPQSQSNPSALTPAKRKRLVLANQEVYEAAIDIVGLVEAVNTRKWKGTLRTIENIAIEFSFDEVFLSELKSALGSSVVYAHIEGVGLYDVNDKLEKVTEIDQLELVPHYHLVNAIDELSHLQDGWLEGGGKALDAKRLHELSNEIVDVFPGDLEYPAAVPTEEGNISFEWIRPKARIELELNFESGKLELYATDLEANSFVDCVFEWGEWAGAFDRVKAILR